VGTEKILPYSNKSHLNDIVSLPIIETAANRTLVLTDSGKVILATDEVTITVPPNADVAFPIGTQIVILVSTASDVDVAAGDGVTIRSRDSYLKIDGQYAGATLFKTAENTWYLIGSLKA
jgi:hypothetical protein